jgi:hypothetical protein
MDLTIVTGHELFWIFGRFFSRPVETSGPSMRRKAEAR